MTDNDHIERPSMEEVRAFLATRDEGHKGLAKKARRLYWYAMGDSKLGDKEPNDLHLYAWCKVVATMQAAGVHATKATLAPLLNDEIESAMDELISRLQETA